MPGSILGPPDVPELQLMQEMWRPAAAGAALRAEAQGVSCVCPAVLQHTWLRLQHGSASASDEGAACKSYLCSRRLESLPQHGDFNCCCRALRS